MEKNKIVLVVEDEPDIASVLKIRLESKGFEVLTASDGREGLSLIREAFPDIVLLDILMPGMNGLQLCSILRTEERLKCIPVVMLTARAGEQAREESMSAGADAYFSKPYDWERLYSSIKEFLNPAS